MMVALQDRGGIKNYHIKFPDTGKTGLIQCCPHELAYVLERMMPKVEITLTVTPAEAGEIAQWLENRRARRG